MKKLETEKKKDNCEKCGHELELCPADWPWHEDYWICPKCESTYVVNEK